MSDFNKTQAKEDLDSLISNLTKFLDPNGSNYSEYEEEYLIDMETFLSHLRIQRKKLFIN